MHDPHVRENLVVPGTSGVLIVDVAGVGAFKSSDHATYLLNETECAWYPPAALMLVEVGRFLMELTKPPGITLQLSLGSPWPGVARWSREA